MAKKQFNLKIDDALLEEVKKIAEKETRSINGQLEHIIKKYVSEYEKNSK